MEPALKTVLEALLFAADEPLPLERLASLVDERPTGEVRAALEQLTADYAAAGRALRVVEVAGGYRLVTRPELAPWVSRLFAAPGRPRLSQPALETLAIVAYKQPVTRVQLEEIRGVNVEGVLRTLIERDLVTVIGRDEGLGRPLLYGTTDAFLTTFGLNSTADLPRMDEIEVFLAEREAALEAEAPGEGLPGEKEASGAEAEASGAEASGTAAGAGDGEASGAR